MVEHHGKWLHNRKFLGAIPDGHCDWLLTVAFYTAVHAVECLFAHDGKPNSHSHHDRTHALKINARYNTIFRSFRPLLEASYVARYDCDTGPLNLGSGKGWVTDSIVRREFICKHLAEIERIIIKLLSLDRTQFAALSATAP
jgi:hypothetical protein